MKLLLNLAVGLSATVGLLAVATKAVPLDETKSDLYDLLGALKHHDDGVVGIGADGVVRSFGPDLNVISYAQLHGHQFQQLMKDFGRGDELDKFKDVDGHAVDYEQLVHPGEHLLPAGFNKYQHEVNTINTTKRSESADYPLAACPFGRCITAHECQKPACKSCYVSPNAWFGLCSGV